VDFIDIAGLVKGASQGEGLGNKFLGTIRETQAILHVVRCFEDDEVVHVDGSVDPIRDIEIIETELILSDIQILESRIDRLKKLRGDKTAQVKAKDGETLLAHLLTGNPASTLPERESDGFVELYRDLGLITAKPVIYCANVDEAGLAEDSPLFRRVVDYAESRDSAVVKISAKVEEELAGLDDEERAEFLISYGVEESGLEKIIHTGYATLGLISYFTVGPKEVRAWTVQRGWKAPKAASVIHTDFERGFIRAEVISYADYVRCTTEAKCRATGVLRVEGKEYVVQDGDVMHFLFNV
jgi:GTP-binding protein YchF